MIKKNIRKIAIILAASLMLSGCGTGGDTAGGSADTKADSGAETSADTSAEKAENSGESADDQFNRETIYQVSLLQGLTFGDYNGSITVKELKERGDIGIGTFDRLNGELIMVDGEVYRAASDGSVEVVPDTETIPFSNVTFFDSDEEEKVESISDVAGLQEVLNAKVSELGENRFYFIRIDGTFKEMNVRSEYAQDKPYKPLAEVLETDQTFFDYENITGTVVGLYCPSYMDKMNATGWHLHFVSDDKTKGGHVLGLSVDKADVKWDYTDAFDMIIPDNEMFDNFDLAIDQSEDIKKVEKNEDTEKEEGSMTDAEAGITYADDGTKLSNDSSDFVLLSEAVPDAILEIRYYSTYNFVGDRIAGYEEPVALLTKEAAVKLKEVSDELKEKGYRLKIFDAYRPQMAVTNFVEWAEDVDDTRMKEYFYPELDKSVLFDQGYIAEHSGHSRGSTLDLTLFDMKLEKEVDMGGTFDYFGELSHPDYKDITNEQYNNRMILREAMMNHGFKPLDEEWWHFTLEDEPYPDTYFTFPVSEDSVK